MTVYFDVGILVVSDTCFQNTSLDKTTAALADYIKKFNEKNRKFNFHIRTTEIVSDNEQDIQTTVKEWSDIHKIRLILTCGGTGFSKKDITPESIKHLLTKEAPGITQLMIQESLKITPMAIMSRPVCGVRGESLIVTLPGSPRGAMENLDIILGSLFHALEQIVSDDSRSIHQKMNRTIDDAAPDHTIGERILLGKSEAESGGCGHHHGHGHGHGLKKHKLISNDISKPLIFRSRESPYPMVPVTEAYTKILEHTTKPVTITMTVEGDLTGYILSEDIHSRSNVPNFRASIVDGYAVLTKDCPGILPVVSVSHASPNEEIFTLKTGQITRITTGAPIPQGAEAVVMVEETEIHEVTADGKEEKSIKVLACDVAVNDNIREIGSDISINELVLPKGHKFSKIGSELGLLISCGIFHVKVYRKPVIGVMSTGDELTDLKDHHGNLVNGQIYDSNRSILISNIRNHGYPVVDLGIARDTENNLSSHMVSALDQCDYLITTGGVSMGELDLVKSTIERKMGGEIHFGRVDMKPGKPTTFATVKNKMIFALPGNPVSASVTFNVFVLPSIFVFCGEESQSKYTVPTLPIVKIQITQDVKLDSRPEYQRVFVYQDEDTVFKGATTGFQRSSRISSLRKANGLLVLPSSKEGKAYLERGAMVDAMIIDSWV